MATDTTTTASGNYLVFHGKEHTGSPELYESGWYFEPNEPHGGDDVFSDMYATRAKALAAAEAWEVEAAAESQSELDEELARQQGVST